ncbi:TMEM175 family protein [Flavivirga sp. 57AJ16]|uniref:TMEM175 family protein n=1 Tax=Flavivirga sp. 57AJ16 TaxID=3025307 RepID=UPI0023653965|nr:TMEM175 family protein [Flavivirga sp. 57AJ16]MDD7885648.1 TMEM175 family protein [Flavivirga sp. 57AJ16]
MKNDMTSERLEAFSDGVLAIIITIMVLELEAPKEYTIEALFEILPTFISYLVSFLYVSIYWVSHHQLFKIAKKINGQILWTNLHLLFWLSVIPFTTDWIGDGNHHSDIIPVVLYGFVLLMSQLSFLLLRSSIVKIHGKTSQVGSYLSGNSIDFICVLTYIIGLYLVFLNTYIAMTIFLLVGILKVIELKSISKKIQSRGYGFFSN